MITTIHKKEEELMYDKVKVIRELSNDLCYICHYVWNVIVIGCYLNIYN